MKNWYSYADSAEDAVKEARACMEVIKGKKFEYPIYFDLEEQSQFAKGRNFCDSVIKAFCGELEKNGYLAGLYCSTYYLNNYNKLKIKLDNDDLGKAFFSFLKDGINGLRLVDFSDIHFQRQGKIAKFYFIVDRIDLASQAKAEFEARGLKVITVDSKEDFVKNISSIGEADKSGKIAFTVVNIQKFSAESVTKKADYNVNVQRVYFMDEAHRSYNPKGSFLANLMASDREAIMIALTGTPLIGEEYNTKDVFGPYIHKYYYNQSIADGYTLKLIREEIETTYRTQMAATLEQLEVQMGSIKKKDLYSHPKFGDQAYQNNPKFKKFIADNGLGFKPYAQFGKAEITERIQLLVQLVNLVWNTEMFV